MRTLRSRDIAERYGVTIRTVEKWVKKGKLSPLPHSVGGWYQFDPQEVERVLGLPRKTRKRRVFFRVSNDHLLLAEEVGERTTHFTLVEPRVKQKNGETVLVFGDDFPITAIRKQIRKL